MLYHVRFLKTPSCSLKADVYGLKTVLTITNDLGDEPFFGDAKIDLLCCVAKSIPVKSAVTWNAGMRSVMCEIKLPRTIGKNSVIVKANVIQATDQLYKDEPAFFALESMPLILPTTSKSITSSAKYAVRTIGLNNSRELRILEETGESIAKHVWDAGYFISGYIQRNLEFFGLSTTKHIRVLELGTGCGIVGLTISSLCPNCTVLLTDLEDAQEICTRNIEENRGGIFNSISFQVLDWESDIPKKESWDLVIVTDCTYNPDSYKALLKVLSNLQAKTITLAHKYRNPSEESFFRQLKDKFDIQFDQELACSGQNIRLLKFAKP